MGIFKKIGAKVLNHYTDKRINESSLSPVEKAEAKKQADEAIDIISTAHENDVKSGGKVLVTFIVGFLQKGPVNAFTSAISTATKEAAANQAKFINDTTSRGVPTYVNGVLINPTPKVDDRKKTIETSALLMGGAGLIAISGVLYWMFSD